MSYKFFASFPSRFPAEAGILSAWVGSFLVLFVTASAAIPLGIAAGIYLEEYAGKNWLTDIIEINIANLAGVPSIVYGLLALGVFVYFFKFGESILTGGLALALLILPMVIMATRGSHKGHPKLNKRGFLCTRRHEMADCTVPHNSIFNRRNPDRDYNRAFKGDRRDRPHNHCGSAYIHSLSSIVSIFFGISFHIIQMAV